MSNWPDVAVIMPVLNEEHYLANSVNAILRQNYPGKLKIVLAVGPSSDQTARVAHELSMQSSQVEIVNSPTGRTPDSLNLAISKCHEEIIIRVDAHSELSEKYIETAVETLIRTGADNVGGIMGATGKTEFEKAVAAAMTSPLGVGSAAFHTGGEEGPAESVYLGVFRKSALERVGGYDTKFTRAQDWEMNHRIRSTGGLIWFNPNLYVVYRPRPNLRKLAKQYFQYGTWRREVMRQHPETKLRKSALRYFVPPATFLGVFFGLVVGAIGVIQQNFLAQFIWLPLTYLIFTLASAAWLSKKSNKLFRYLPIVLPAMQLSWGAGFLFGNIFSKTRVN